MFLVKIEMEKKYVLKKILVKYRKVGIYVISQYYLIVRYVLIGNPWYPEYFWLEILALRW